MYGHQFVLWWIAIFSRQQVYKNKVISRIDFMSSVIQYMMASDFKSTKWYLKDIWNSCPLWFYYHVDHSEHRMSYNYNALRLEPFMLHSAMELSILANKQVSLICSLCAMRKIFRGYNITHELWKLNILN